MASVIESWDSLSITRRMTLVIGVLVIIVLSVVAFNWIYDKDYQLLFGELEARDAASVVTELDRLKIDYRLAAAGSEIHVPSAEVHNVRLKLMGTGMPLGGGVGFEIFDESDFGMTDFAQQINYQRALEGELTRTIMSLEEVKYARVHLVMPERGLFQQDDSPPSASVTLFLKQKYLGDNNRPRPVQIEGIQRLVSSAVPNLQMNQVIVSDQAGVTLSRMMSDQKGMAAISGRLQQKQAVELYLTDKVNSVLIHTFGDGQAMVSVDVSLNFNEVKRTLEGIITAEDSNDGIVRRRETRMSSGTENKTTGGNVTTEIEYELGRKIEQIIESPGEIKRLSVGVMIPAGVTSERRLEIKKLVEMTVGLNEARGDALELYTIDSPGIVPRLELAELPVSLDRILSTPPTTKTNEFPQSFRQLISQRPFVTGALGASLGLIFLYTLFRLMYSRVTPPSDTRQLSGSERQEVLLKLTGWLEAADALPEGDRS